MRANMLRRSAPTALWTSVLLLLSALPPSHCQSNGTSASLNNPTASYVVKTVSASPTTVQASGTTASTLSQPTETGVTPIAYTDKQVPFLLSLPEYAARDMQWGGPTFTGCSDAASVTYADAPFRINVSAVYTQLDRTPSSSAGKYGMMRIVAVGAVGNETHAFANSITSTGTTVGLLSAVGTRTHFLTFPVYENYTYLCDQLYPTSNDTLNPNVNPPSCQYGPGEIAFGMSVPLNSSYEAGTLWTQIRLTDASNPARTLTCIEVQASPYEPNRWYWKLVLWLPVALFVSFFVLASVAALITSVTTQRMAYKNRAREGGPPTFVRDKLRPTILSALAGREMVRSPALLRFITPGCWDVLLHLQFLVALAMCHVRWPDFTYPFLRQAAWSALLGNVTIVENAGESHSLLSTNASLPDGDIGSQMSNVSSPLYLNGAQGNNLLNLGTASIGMERYAAAVGLRPSSLFGTCLSIWLAIIAGLLIVSGVAWAVDHFFEAQHERKKKQELASGEITGVDEVNKGTKESSVTPLIGGEQSKTPTAGRARHRRRRNHFVALHGNLVRALVLFHLPITIVSVYQFAHASGHSKTSIALAALSFAAFSLAAPVYILWQLARLSTERLYEDTRVLLALGPVYHAYAPGSQLYYGVSFAHSLALGIVVGAGQANGAAQAIVILIIEVVAALASSLWLPWGDGAMMGPLNFMTAVLRLITVVLVLLLTKLVGFSHQACGWLGYVILLLQAIFFAGATLVLLSKLVEAFVRMVWRLRFDESFSGRTAGLGGAIRKIRRRKMKNRKAIAVGGVPLQMRPVLPSAHHMRTTSMGSATTLRMLEKMPGTQSPMHGSQRLSYNDYLEYGSKRTQSGGSELELLERMGYSPPYGRAAGTRSPGGRLDDSIMAAMPAPNAGGGGGGFVRIAGGRAQESQPYTPQQRPHRPQSTAGIAGTNWKAEQQQQRRMEQRPRPLTHHDFSSTQQAASHAARQTMAGVESRRAVKGKDGLFSWKPKWQRRRGGGDEDDSESSDDEDEEGGTWNSRIAAENRVPWTGAVKISSAIQSLFGVGQSRKAGVQPVSQTMEPAPAAEKGFEVVRKPRPGAGATAATSASTSSVPTPVLADTATSTPERAAADFYAERLPAEDESHSTPFSLYQGPHGMLGADLQRASSSAGHTIDEERNGGEDRFWLPPIELHTDTEHDDGGAQR